MEPGDQHRSHLAKQPYKSVPSYYIKILDAYEEPCNSHQVELFYTMSFSSYLRHLLQVLLLVFFLQLLQVLLLTLAVLAFAIVAVLDFYYHDHNFGVRDGQ